jgi:hypothetical protein
MPAPSNTSPNIGNLQVGKGVVSFMKTGDSVFRDLGEVLSLTLNPAFKTLDHYTQRTGTKLKDNQIIIEKASTIKMVMEEFTADNMALMLDGNLDHTGALSAIAATGVYTASALVDTDTITIGAKTYTVQATLTNVNGNVKLGANLTATLLNLLKAINLSGVAGTDYAAAMTLNTDVTATTSDATHLNVTAKALGTAGNTVATTDTATNGAWGAATLTGGVGPVGPTVDIFATAGAVTGWLRFTGDNDVGPKLQLDLYNVSFTPTGNVDFISDQWGKLEATGDCLAAVSGPNVGRFGLVTVLNVAPGP